MNVPKQAPSPSRPHSAASNAAWNAFHTLWTSGISLILTPWLIGRLGLDYYGILLLIWSLTGVLGIMNLGLGEATLRYVALHYSRNDLAAINRVVGSTLTIYIAASGIVSLGLVAWAPLVASQFRVATDALPLVHTLVRMTAIVVTLGILSRTVGAIPAALQRYDISTKVNVAHSVLRFGGYIALLALGLGVFHLVLWDVVTLSLMFVVQVIVARRLLPGIALWPRLSRADARELLGYSVFSFLTYVFHTMHRESAKWLTGGFMGLSGVSYIGVPDSLSQRVHGVVASAGETLLPRFSATADRDHAMALFWQSTWVATMVTVTVFVPYTILLPDFLRLWIGPDFAALSATAGQLVALSYVTQSIFVPAATLARGSGRPGVVTAVVLSCGLVMLAGGAALIQAFGLVGAGVGYLVASLPAAAGTAYIARRFSGASPWRPMLRAVGLPILAGAGAFLMTLMVKRWIGDLHWAGLLIVGGLSAGGTALIVIASETVAGGSDSRARGILVRTAHKLGWGPALSPSA